MASVLSTKGLGRRGPMSHPWNVEHTHFDAKNVALVGNWVTVTDAIAMGCTYTQSSTAGDTITVSFYGAGLWAYLRVGSDAGQISVTVDSVVTIPSLDLYSSSKGRVPSWVAVGLQTVDAKGIPIYHVVTITVLSSKNPNTTNTYVRVEGFEVEVEAGALQVLAFLEQTVTTSSTTSSTTALAKLIEADAQYTGNASTGKNIGVAVVANTGFGNSTINLSQSEDVLVTLQILCSASVTVQIFRGSTSIASQVISANTFSLIHVKDSAVASGNQTYSIQVSSNSNVWAVMQIVDQLGDEFDILVSGSLLIDYNGATGSGTATASIGLNVAGNVWIQASALNNDPGTWKITRDGVTLVSGNLDSQKIIYEDINVSAGSHNYVLTFSPSQGTDHPGGAIMLISNGG